MEFNHVSVLLNECISFMKILPNGCYVDGTLGKGGHSAEICSQLAEGGRLIAIDQDAEALAEGRKNLSRYGDMVTFAHTNFSDIKNTLNNLGIKGIDGMLLDLGVSSYQLDTGERGFSYMNDGMLDMRMDRRGDITAYDIVNSYKKDKLERIIYDYGEERWAKRIAEFIVNSRSQKPIQTTFELVSVIKAAVPKGARQDGPHPAKRTFQAIRIEVNSELEILRQTVFDACDCLNPGGRLLVITFHSLEDKIIKNAFRDLENPCKCPKELPICVCGKQPEAKVITRKPVLPSDEELEQNHRSRSAKLRVIEKRG